MPHTHRGFPARQRQRAPKSTGISDRVIGCDQVSFSGSATGAFADKTVGTGKTVTANLSSFNLTGVIGADQVALNGKVTATFADLTVGTNKPVITDLAGVSLTGIDAGAGQDGRFIRREGRQSPVFCAVARTSSVRTAGRRRWTTQDATNRHPSKR